MKITLQAPRTGIAQSPHVGIADIRNFDIDSVEGVAQLNNILVKKSGTTVTAQVNWIVRHPVTTTEIYALDDAGTVYKSANSGSTWAILAGSSSTSAHGNGLAIWNNYLIVARDTKLDVCGDGSGTGIVAANWTLDWQSIDSDNLWHPLYTSINDSKLYGGAGQYIFSLEELTTFVPGTGATFTFTAQALDLPEDYRIKCLEELGNNLMIGTWQGTNIYDERIANIFQWDRSSVSFGQPIVLDEYGIHAMKFDGNSLIVLAGIDGIIYSCNGASAWAIGQLPQDLSGGKYLEFYPGALIKYKNKMFFGVGQGGTQTISGMGVYSLKQTGKGNILNYEHNISTLSDGSLKPLKTSALLPVTRDTLLVGWRDDTTYGIDLTLATSYAYTTDYVAYFDSPLYEVGDELNKWKPTEIKFHLGKPLATGEGIQVKYRKSLSDDWVTIKTMAFADNKVGAMISRVIVTDVDLTVLKGEQIQLRVALKGTATTTPQFKFLIMK